MRFQKSRLLFEAGRQAKVVAIQPGYEIPGSCGKRFVYTGSTAKSLIHEKGANSGVACG
jgi:hypothetical protein